MADNDCGNSPPPRPPKKRDRSGKLPSTGRGGPGRSSVAGVPVANAGRFSFDLVKAGQCIAQHEYLFDSASEEHLHFTKLVHKVLLLLPVGAEAHPMMEAVIDKLQRPQASHIDLAEVFTVKSIMVGQLRNLSMKNTEKLRASLGPPRTSPDYVPDAFETFTVKLDGEDKEFVQGPAHLVRALFASYSSMKRSQPLQPSHSSHGISVPPTQP